MPQQNEKQKRSRKKERKSKELPIDESKFKGLHQNKSWMASIHIFLHKTKVGWLQFIYFCTY